MGKWLVWCDHLIRACNKLKWLTPFKWPQRKYCGKYWRSDSIVYVLCTENPFDSFVFCELTVQLRKCIKSHWNDRGCRCSSSSPPFTVSFAFTVEKRTVEIRILCIQCQRVVERQWTRQRRWWWWRRQWHVFFMLISFLLSIYVVVEMNLKNSA